MSLAIASPSAQAASETFIRMQVERLPCRMRIHGGPVANETIPGGPIEPLRSIRGLMDTAIEVLLYGSKWDGPQRKELKRRLKRQGIRVILANYGPCAVALLPVCVDLNIALVAHFHGYDAHLGSIVREYGDRYRELGRVARTVIAVSSVMAQTLEGLGVPRKLIRIVRCGSDERLFCEKRVFPQNPLYFGVGRFVDKKAPYLTLLAFAKVRERCPAARLVLAGEGPLLEVTQNLARALGLSSAVEFPGVVTPDQVAKYMQEATAFVQHSIVPHVGPSRGDSEGTPVAVLEAMLTGLPVVATRHAGIGEVIQDGKTGLLIEERDIDGMAKAMLKVAQDRDFARALGQAARREALEKYTGDCYIRSLKEILNEAAGLELESRAA
ncbi:MAG: glycosyltransferase [Veillonellaceae bacterium]|nr:glycosyltransferase [Veillonellaceae bacterium]